jgi:hypothetical protein
MVSRNVILAAAGVVAAMFVFGLGMFGRNENESDGSSSSPNASPTLDITGLIDSSPAPDATLEIDPVVQPVNAITEGSIYQGPDPLNLAPGEEGRGDAIAPINPGNIVTDGPIYVGPDPLNLGGN